jgi:hypothetical protein
MNRAEFYRTATKSELESAEEKLTQLKDWLKRKVEFANNGSDYVGIAALANEVTAQMAKIEEIGRRVRLIENITKEDN